MKKTRVAVSLVMVMLLSLLLAVGAFADTKPNLDWGTAMYQISISQNTDKHTTIKGCQYILSLKSSTSPGTVDGWFGSQTKASVQAYQSAHGLSSDGIVGFYTWRSLKGNLGIYQDDSYCTSYYVVNNSDPYDYNKDYFEHFSDGRWTYKGSKMSK